MQLRNMPHRLSPSPPHFNVNWQNIFSTDPSAQHGCFNIEIGGAGGCTKVPAAFGSCVRETFELAKFRPSTVSGEGRCALSQSTTSMDKATHSTVAKTTKRTMTAKRTTLTNTAKTTSTTRKKKMPTITTTRTTETTNTTKPMNLKT